MQTLQMDEFLRSLKQNIGTPHALLLGAGASVESGVQSAADCIWEWKKEIFLSQNPGMIGTYDNSKQDNVRRVIQRWIDAQNSYPTENSPEEYSFFVEKAYRIPQPCKERHKASHRERNALRGDAAFVCGSYQGEGAALHHSRRERPV